MVSTAILEQVGRADPERTLRAIQGLTSGAYTVRVVRQTECEIQADVANGDGKTYPVTLATTGCSCSCPDFIYKNRSNRPCKHAVLLALYTIRHPQEQPIEGEHKPNLKLAKVREGYCG